MTSAPPIGFDYRPSRWLIAAVAVVAALAVVALALSGLPLSLRLVAAALIVVAAASRWRRFADPPVRSLVWRGDGGANVRFGQGDGETDANAQVRHARVLGPLIVIEVAWGERRHAALWLLPDNLDAETRRRLRVRIRAATVPAPL